MRVVDIDALADAKPRDDRITPEEAWVIDARARRGHPADFDRDLLAGSAGQSGRRPQLVALPGSLAALEARVADYRMAGAPSVLRICPGPSGHGYPLEDWVLSPLPEYCDRERLALIVDVSADGMDYPWAALVRLARDHPSLPVVALGAPLRAPTAARALDAAANLVLDASGVVESGTRSDLADLVAEVGAYRFAYGSGRGRVPATDVAAALPDAEVDMVLAGTADLLGSGRWGSRYL